MPSPVHVGEVATPLLVLLRQRVTFAHRGTEEIEDEAEAVAEFQALEHEFHAGVAFRRDARADTATDQFDKFFVRAEKDLKVCI
jgi:hypothetical protein